MANLAGKGNLSMAILWGSMPLSGRLASAPGTALGPGRHCAVATGCVDGMLASWLTITIILFIIFQT